MATIRDLLGPSARLRALLEPPAPQEQDFTNQYNTQLSPADEKAFQQWAMQRALERGHKKIDTYDYDLRGAWQDLMSGAMQQAANGHLGDKYKKPNHPTFSDQSQYHGVDGYYGGSWGDGMYTPSATNMQFRSPQELQQYFHDNEHKYRLYLPPELM